MAAVVFFFNFRVDNVPEDNRVVLPPLLHGAVVINMCFLCRNVAGRPYRVEDFRASVDQGGVLADMVCLGTYHINHSWTVTLKTIEANRKLLAAKELLVKENKCFVLDQSKAEVRLKIHWVAHHITNDSASNAVVGYGIGRGDGP